MRKFPPSMIAAISLLVMMCSHWQAVSAALTSEDFIVEGLEEVEPAFATFEGGMYAGLLSIDEQDHNQQIVENGGGKLMFWLFEPEAPTVNDSLVIWFNGGPGCSSLDAGMLFENGPVTTPLHPAGYCCAPNDAPYVPNPYAWTNATAILYVEQPVGVGFSYGAEPPQDEHDVSRDFYNFLQNFFHVFSKHRSKRLYLVGESYGGMYIPSVAHYIFNANKKKKDSRDLINLAGIGVGNGWVDAMIQGPMVIDYAWWHGMIDSVTRDALHVEWEQCKLRGGSEQPPPFHRFTVPDECGIMEAVLKASGAGLVEWGNPNTYDVTTWDPYYFLTHPNSASVRFFNDPRVRQALNVPDNGRVWAGCIPGEGRRRRRLSTNEENTRTTASSHLSHFSKHQLLLDDDKPVAVTPYIAELLDEAGIHVLIYNGDRDMSTNVQGSETILDGMEWSGAADWSNPDVYRRALWMVDDKVAGYAKSVKRLEFVVVYNSGHLVPHNQPLNALDLITRLLKEEPFGDVDIPPVFKVKAVTQKTETSSGFWNVVAGFVGLVAGIAGVLVFFALRRKHARRLKQEYTYDQVGDVEIESP